VYSVEVLVHEEADSRGLIWVNESQSREFGHGIAWRVVDSRHREVGIFESISAANVCRNMLNNVVQREDYEAAHCELVGV
jgi:hypothetical protein